MGFGAVLIRLGIDYLFPLLGVVLIACCTWFAARRARPGNRLPFALAAALMSVTLLPIGFYFIDVLAYDRFMQKAYPTWPCCWLSGGVVFTFALLMAGWERQRRGAAD
jgi:hypothetical protein